MYRFRRWLIILGLGAVAATGSVLAYRAWPSSPEALVRQARAALDRDDPLEAARLVWLLQQQGDEEHAALIQCEVFTRAGRSAMEQAARLAQQERAEQLWWFMGNMAGLSSQPLFPAHAVSLLHAGAFPPLELTRLRQHERFTLEDRARDALGQTLAQFRKIRDGGPLQAAGSVLAGECLMRLRELGMPVPLQEAVRVLTFAVERNPDDLAARRWLAGSYIDLHAIPFALEHLEAWGRLDPQDGRPYRWIGMFQYKDYEEGTKAQAAYRRALERSLEPRVRAEVARELAEVLLLAEANYQGALAALDQCPPAFAGDPEILTVRAEALLGLGRHAEAAKVVAQALQEQPNLPAALLVRAEIDLATEQAQAALPVLERAARLAPYDLKIRHRLAEAYSLLGDTARAAEQRRLLEETQKRKVQIDKMQREAITRPWDDQLRYEIGVMLLKLNHLPEAQTWLRASLTCNPNHQQARELLARLQKQQ
jgi:tetratricopeptide (TPR) repeat protein